MSIDPRPKPPRHRIRRPNRRPSRPPSGRPRRVPEVLRPVPRPGSDWSLGGLIDRLEARVVAESAELPGVPVERWLYRAVDAWAAAIDAELHRPSPSNRLAVLPEPVCKSGCDHCCYQHVAVTNVEAAILDDHIRRLPDEEAIALRGAILDEAERTARLLDEAPTPENQRETLARLRRPCPLLDTATGRCRVYEVRPINCRRENSLDAEVCRRYRHDPEATDSSLRLVRYDLIWGAAQAFLVRWSARHLGSEAIGTLECVLGSALRAAEGDGGRRWHPSAVPRSTVGGPRPRPADPD